MLHNKFKTCAVVLELCRKQTPQTNRVSNHFAKGLGKSLQRSWLDFRGLYCLTYR